jgi:5-methylcytosine-specific restriction endonuclease McrA
MNDRHRDSVKARRICFETHRWQNEAGQWRLTCHVCKTAIDPIRRNSWRSDHIRRWAEGGEDTPENLWPICTICDAKKAPQDTREVAKGKRVRDSIYVGKRSSRSLPGSRGTGIRKRMSGAIERQRADGTWERREPGGQWEPM